MEALKFFEVSKVAVKTSETVLSGLAVTPIPWTTNKPCL